MNRARRCEEDLHCLTRSRQQRWIYNDLGTLAISLGAGLVGYSLANNKKSHALLHLRLQPAVSTTHAGLGLSGSS